MSTLYSLQQDTVVDEGQVDFGFKDQLGRHVGYRWVISPGRFVAKTNDERWGYAAPTDGLFEFFMLVAYPTRNTKHYGASGRTLRFATLEEARRAAVKRVEQAQKRDAKKFAKEAV
jgi:hypothetical protein